jgi:hypothetical protein
MRCQFEGQGVEGNPETRQQARKSNMRVTFWSRSGLTPRAILLAKKGTIYVANCEQRAVAEERLHGNKPQ